MQLFRSGMKTSTRLNGIQNPQSVEADFIVQFLSPYTSNMIAIYSIQKSLAWQHKVPITVAVKHSGTRKLKIFCSLIINILRK